MNKSLFVRPRGTGFQGRISFDDDDSMWRRHEATFKRRTPWVVTAIKVTMAATALYLFGTVVFLIVGGLLTR
jgi:hypothetical protein